jgi:hypothetical protein
MVVTILARSVPLLVGGNMHAVAGKTTERALI